MAASNSAASHTSARLVSRLRNRHVDPACVLCYVNGTQLRPFAYTIHLMNTVVYVNGFNLYYRALRDSPHKWHKWHKWFDLNALCAAALPHTCNITAISYSTARVSSRRNPSSPTDQNTYLAALRTLPSVRMHLGNFQVTDKWMYLVQSVELRALSIVSAVPNPDCAYVSKTEETGPDVNLGVHPVRDALTGVFEHAAVVTNDTDRHEPLRIVSREAGLPVTLLTPVDHPAEGLKRRAARVRHLRRYLGVSHFPDPVIGPNGPIAKPSNW